MSQEITTMGLVATTPRHLVTREGLAITSFRLASSNRIYNRSNGTWSDETNWYTITSFRTLAINTATSISKGDRVMISGVLRVRDWDNGTNSGTSVEIEATGIAHDLNYGSSTFVRSTFSKDPDTTPDTEDLTADL